RLSPWAAFLRLSNSLPSGAAPMPSASIVGWSGDPVRRTSGSGNNRRNCLGLCATTLLRVSYHSCQVVGNLEAVRSNVTRGTGRWHDQPWQRYFSQTKREHEWDGASSELCVPFEFGDQRQMIRCS